MFLKNWGITRRLSSAYFPRSNGRAELGVKSGKRLLMANLDMTGSMNREAISQARLAYRNTPLQDCSISPAELLYGRKLRDHLPVAPAQDCEVLPKWKEIRQAREAVLSSRIAERAEKSWSTKSPLRPLTEGQHVLIQNNEGNRPARWDRSGMVVQVLPYRQYRVKYDGSGRLQIRNRQHLRAFVPPHNTPSYPPIPSVIVPDASSPPSTPSTPPPAHASTPIRHQQSAITAPPSLQGTPSQPTFHRTPTPQHTQPLNEINNEMTIAPPSNDTAVPQTHNPDQSETIPYNITDPMIRRSTRYRQPPERLSPKLKGKTHIRD